jgi:peptidoglycan/LPS O-acetylase OafA/YrhL
MTTPSEQEGHPSSFPLFDWLRFAMASVVALGHQDVITWPQAGNLAVQVFFALSGWLIGGILLRTERSGLARFFFKRGTRIWIPYAAAVAALYSVSLIRDPVTSEWLRHLFTDLTFTHNWFIDPDTDLAGAPLNGTGHHFWSIAVEEQFYLAAPLIMLGLARGKRLETWIAVAVLTWLFTPYFGTISFGVLAAVAQRDFGNWHLRAGARALLGAMALSAGAVLVLFPATYHHAAPFLSIALVLLLAIEGKRGKAGIFFGGMSYPLYLNHWMGTFAANAIAKRFIVMPGIATGLLAYMLAFAAGSIAYLLIDRQIQRRRDAFYTPKRGKVFAATAYSLLVLGLIGGSLWPRTIL